MTDQVRTTPDYPAEPPALSSVKIEMNSKGMAQPKVSVYDGVTEDEMKRLATLALTTFNDVTNRLGARANFS